jgi:predicted ester cyclase
VSRPEENKRLALEFTEKVFNEHDIGYLKDALSEDFVDQSPAPGMMGDKAGTIAFFEQLFQNMPDLHGEVIHAIASGDTVAIHGMYTGTDKGGFMPGMAPTNKQVSMRSIDISEFGEDGKQVSHFGIQDIMGAMMQLGLVPTPEGAEGHEH